MDYCYKRTLLCKLHVLLFPLPARGDMDGGLALVEEFPDLPPHTSSLATAVQLSLERGGEGEAERVRVKMTEVSGERNANNVMFFGHLRAGQVTQANRILEVCTCVYCVPSILYGAV